MDKIGIADIVRHTPTGETWDVARVTDTHVYPVGWPPCCAPLENVQLLMKATPDMREAMLEALEALPDDDARRMK